MLVQGISKKSQKIQNMHNYMHKICILCIFLKMPKFTFLGISDNSDHFCFFSPKIVSGLKRISEFMHILCFPENELPQFFYGMVVIGSLSMVGDGGGCGGVALGGRWEGFGKALAGHRW